MIENMMDFIFSTILPIILASTLVLLIVVVPILAIVDSCRADNAKVYCINKYGSDLEAVAVCEDKLNHKSSNQSHATPIPVIIPRVR